MTEITKTDDCRPFIFPLWLFLAFVAAVVFVYFFGLTIPLLGPDEPRYTQVAREMFERRDWITPMLGGHNWFEKPALLYWLQITSFNVFGVGEFAARFGSALFGLGTILSLWFIGRAATSHRDLSRYIALVAATSIGLIVFSRGASFDIIVTFPITAALCSYFYFERTKKIAPLAGFYIFIGLSLIAKGLIGMVFPFAIVSFYHILARKIPGKTLIISLFWGTAVSAIVASAWYLPVYLQNGWEFVDEFIIQHHFQRFTSNKYQHPQPFYFFWWVLPLMTFPWLPFFFGRVWKQLNIALGRIDQTEDVVSDSRLDLFAIAWLLVPLVFFSFSGSKLPGYILPAVPGALILTALSVTKFASRTALRRNFVLSVGGVVLVTISILLVTAVPRFAETDSVKTLIQKADERSFRGQRVMMVYTLSHNAEFYAAGRLLRDETGKQRTFYQVEQLLPFLNSEPERRALVLVPIEHLDVLKKNSNISTEVIGDNSELAIAAISAK